MDTKDYGISVASRVNTHLAESLLLKAEKMGLTMSKYLSIQLATIDKKADEIAKLKKQVEQLEHNAKVKELKLRESVAQLIRSKTSEMMAHFDKKYDKINKVDLERVVVFIFNQLGTKKKHRSRIIEMIKDGEHRE